MTSEQSEAEEWFHNTASNYEGALISDGEEKFYYHLRGVHDGEVRYIGDSPGMIEHYSFVELHDKFKMGDVVPATVDEENELFDTINGTVKF